MKSNISPGCTTVPFTSRAGRWMFTAVAVERADGEVRCPPSEPLDPVDDRRGIRAGELRRNGQDRETHRLRHAAGIVGATRVQRLYDGRDCRCRVDLLANLAIDHHDATALEGVAGVYRRNVDDGLQLVDVLGYRLLGNDNVPLTGCARRHKVHPPSEHRGGDGQRLTGGGQRQVAARDALDAIYGLLSSRRIDRRRNRIRRGTDRRICKRRVGDRVRRGFGTRSRRRTSPRPTAGCATNRGPVAAYGRVGDLPVRLCNGRPNSRSEGIAVPGHCHRHRDAMVQRA